MFARSLHLYPLKSGSSVDVKTAMVFHDGLRDDRRMMAVSENGRFLTAREYPKLLKVFCTVDGDMVSLSAAGSEEVTFRRMPPEGKEYRSATIWQDRVDLWDAGDIAADWLSRFIGHPCRLLHQGPLTRRALGGFAGFVNLADTAPILLISEASLAKLNEYLVTTAEMARFRPNIVIRGGSPFQEDEWALLRIGGVEFEAIGPCSRCKMTTLDPETSDERPGSEPLATLSRIRRGLDGEAYFGEFLRPRSVGRIHVGDQVTIISRKALPDLHPMPTSPRMMLPEQPARVEGDGLDLVCEGIADETPDMKTFRFKIQGGFRARYKPGQFITLNLLIDGVPVKRSYTISSSPTRPYQIAITVKRKREGRVSNWLHDRLQPGMHVKASGPNGRFHLGNLGEETTQKLFILSAGSGITPMISMLRAIVDLDLQYDINFHHSCRTQSDMAFRAELGSLKIQLGERLTVTWNLTDASETGDRREDLIYGRLDERMLMSVCPDIGDRLTLCCGPEGFRTTARSLHAKLAPESRFSEESFGQANDQAVEDVEAPFAIHFVRSGKTATGTGSQTLLDLARLNHIPLESDCEAGICGKCRCRIIEGDWQVSARCADPSRAVLSNDEKSRNYVLACTTRIAGPGVVDL